MRVVLAAASVYNIAWGGWVILRPHAWFDLAALPRPIYPQIWQCVGMIVGVYGVGYAIAAWNPLRHWPIVLVGLLGKILGPMGFAAAVLRGDLPVSMGWVILGNDLIWWGPFIAILWQTWQRRSRPGPARAAHEDEAPDGRTLPGAAEEGARG